MNHERPSADWWSMWRRFAIASVLIVALSAGATTTIALNKLSTLANEVFPAVNHIAAPKGLVTPEYNGGPQTFLILGSDRRAHAKDSFDREDPPHSDTILLVRFDPEQGQTSVMSIPRDLMVNIITRSGATYANEKINAAYTIGAREAGVRGASVLAAETIKREVFPGLRLNGIVDVSFAGFIKVVDTLGCAYVNVDHRYLGGGSLAENFSAINLQPGYQKLCYNDALEYVRYRHTDSDFVRVARQQDFLRALRDQISASDVLEQVETVAKAVGNAISSTFKPSGSLLLELAKLVAFSQSKPLRQVKFQTANVNLQQNGGSYVTSTPELEQATLNDFLHGRQQLQLPATASSHGHSQGHGHSHAHSSAGPSAASLDLYPSSSSGQGEAVQAAVKLPFTVLYPSLQTGAGEEQTVRPYQLRDRHGKLHWAYVAVWRENTNGGYYDFEGTDWLDPPLFDHARPETIAGRRYMLVDDGAHIHAVGWRSHGVLYSVTNTLLEDLSNSQMLAIARSAHHLH